MAAEAALDVVVLAVHVVGDPPPRVAKAGPGRDRRREAQRQEGGEQRAEGDPGSATSTPVSRSKDSSGRAAS
jgi:hypothetical protein